MLFRSAPTPAPPVAFAGNVPRRVQVIPPTAQHPPPQQAPAAPGGRKVRRRRYVPEPEGQWHWDNARPVEWPDVHLPEGWHLNPQRIPVSVPPSTARARLAPTGAVSSRRSSAPTRPTTSTPRTGTAGQNSDEMYVRQPEGPVHGGGRRVARLGGGTAGCHYGTSTTDAIMPATIVIESDNENRVQKP